MIYKLPLTPVRTLLVVTVFLVICLVFSSWFGGEDPSQSDLPIIHPTERANKVVRRKTNMPAEFWRSVNLKTPDIPELVHQKVNQVLVESHNVNVMGVETFYREARPPNGVSDSGETVVLLHGMAFKSETWLNLGTIHLLAAMGHRVVAIDLPGYGETTSKLTGSRAEYLHLFLALVNAIRPIIVSPSMSGGFSVPALIDYPLDFGGFVPVAPVGTEHLHGKASQVMIPTLIIYGEKDKGLGHQSLEDLGRIRPSQAIELPGAGHAAYLDQPKMFHTLLYNFVRHVHEHAQEVV